MDVNAFGLAAGRKHAKARRPLPNAFLARNVNPRKSNDWFGKSTAPPETRRDSGVVSSPGM